MSAPWGLERLEGLLRDNGIPPHGKAARSLADVKASGLTEEQATALWAFVSVLLDDHAEVVRQGCIRAIEAMGGIAGRD
jgi:hypothetical protein